MSNCQRVLNRELDWGLEALVGHVSLNYGTCCPCLQFGCPPTAVTEELRSHSP